MDRVNNWDPVDASADKILGAFLQDKDRSVLDELAASDGLWQQRISIIATDHFIKHDEFQDALRIARTLLASGFECSLLRSASMTRGI